MAEMYTPEEIQEIFQAYNDAIKSGTPVSAELAKAMKDAEKGVKGWTDSTNAQMKKLGTSAVDLTKNLYKGGNAADNFGGALEQATGAVSALVLLIPGIGIAVKVAAVAIAAFGKAVNVAGKQADSLFKSYQDLSKVGATTAGGIQDVFVQMQGLGYGIEELDKMIRIVSENSTSFAKYSLSAGRGVTEFSSAMESLNRDPVLRVLGKLPDDINSAGVSFVKQQLAMGRSQRDVGDSLGAQTRKYILELDRLQKLTGVSADVLQKQQEEAMAEDAYNVYMEMLEEQGEAGKLQADKIKEVMARMPDQYRKLVAQAIGGNVEAQQQLMFVAPNLIKDLQDPIKSTSDTLKTLNTDATNFKGAMKGGYLVAADAFREIGGPVKELNELIVSTTDVDARNKAVKEDAKVTEKSTQNMAILQLENMKARDALQSFVQLGVHPASRALKNFAEVASGAAKTLPGKGPGAAPSAPSAGTAAAVRSGKGGGAVAPGDAVGVVEAGKGYTTIQTADGQKQRREGTRAWRNNNPGNIEYGKFAISQGAVGSDGRFAVFANKEAGDRAREALLFGGSYGGLTIAQAIAKYAPSNENDTQRYLQEVLNSTMASPDTVMSNLNGSQRKNLLDAMARVEGYKTGSVMAARNGGMFSGPTSGYNAVLHGTEAIVPLPDGKKIPVEIPGFTANLNDQNVLLSQQLAKLDDIINVMRRQVDVSTKILQRAS